jgi:hypothetical protein
VTTPTPYPFSLNNVVILVVAKRGLPRIATASCSTVAKEIHVVACRDALPPSRNGRYTDRVGSAHSIVGFTGHRGGERGDDEEGGNCKEGSGGMHPFYVFALSATVNQVPAQVAM